jgi:hypothetical protein
MKICKMIFSAVFFLLACWSCSQNPLESVNDPSRYTGSWGSTWVLYDDVLNTLGGDVMFYPSDPGPAVFSLSNVNNSTSYSGKKYFHCQWNGQPIYWASFGGLENAFAGFSLITTSNPAYYDTVLPLDLHKSPYTKITFYARGQMSSSISNHVKFEGPNGAVLDNVIPTSTWTKYTINLKDLNYVKVFFKVTIIYPSGGYPTYGPPGRGGWVDVDLISYEE